MTAGRGKALPSMQFFEPTSVEAAISLLATHDDAHCLAGGATLVALMNAGLVEPAALISLQHIETLRGIERGDDGVVTIGAMTRHEETAASNLFHEGQAIVPAAARQIANMVVRNMGTMGGSIAFADPAADYPCALIAAGAEIEITNAAGARWLPVADICVDWYETVLDQGELVTRIRIPPAPAGSVSHYEKLARVSGDFAVVSVALILAFEGAVCSAAQVAVGGCGPWPLRLAEVESMLVGSALDEKIIAAAGGLLVAASDPVDDVRGSAEYRRQVIPRLLAKSIALARSDALAQSDREAV